MTELIENQYAGFWIRVGASLLDSIIMAFPAGISMFAIYYLQSYWLVLVLSIITIIYKPFMEYIYGATLGKMAIDLRVISQDGGMLNIKQSMIRSSPWIISGIYSLYSTLDIMFNPVFQADSSFAKMTELQMQSSQSYLQTLFSLFLLACVLVVAIDHQKKGIHDMMANTFCVRVKNSK